MNETVCLLSLQNKPGIGGVTLRKLIDIYGSAANVFKADIDGLIKSGMINKESAQAIKGFNKWDIYFNEYKKIEKSRYRYIAYNDTNYPVNLKNIYNVPLLMQYYGDIRNIDNNAIAVVGSRNCDEYGRYITEAIVKQLVTKGITIVSGMARGIDTYAHMSAIKYGGRTVAVIGSGLDICYPPENNELFEVISQNGYILSEYPLGTKPESTNFPRRNRIISGLSLGVLVIQANLKSGALITAKYALEQNREIFAVPANINNLKSSGCNLLIKNGAKLVENVDDIISEINQFQGLKNKKEKADSGVEKEKLSENEKTVIKTINNKRLHMDELQISSKLSSSEIFQVLLDMEMKGIIRVLPGNYYELKDRE